MPRVARRVAACGLALLAAACGGGSGDPRTVDSPVGAIPDRDLWHMTVAPDALTAVWLGPGVRARSGPEFRFLNVVHHGPEARFAAFARPVPMNGSTPVVFADEGLRVEVEPDGMAWSAVQNRTQLRVQVSAP